MTSFNKLIYLFVICITVFNCGNNSSRITSHTYPSTQKISITDHYFGKSITDDYRHLENLKDTSTINWFKAQDNYTEENLNKLSYQKLIKEDMKAYFSNDNLAISMVKYADNGYVFFLQNEPDQEVKKLFFKMSPESKSIELFILDQYFFLQFLTEIF